MSTIHTAVVLHEQAAMGLLRDWISYLTARLALLTSDDPSSTTAFERDAAAQQTSATERELAAIPPENRTLFAQATSQRREERRQQLEAELRAEANGTPRLIDPDDLDRRVLHELLSEAREPDESGHVLFPTADGAQIEWLELRVSALTERPDGTTYRAAQHTSRDRERLTRIAAGLAIVALLAFLAWYLFNTSAEPTATATGASANGQDVMLWQTTSLLVHGTTDTRLPITVTTSAGWPTDDDAHLQPISLPLHMCVPAAALAGATTITLIGDGSTPDRVYALSMEAPAHLDLLIQACDDSSVQIAGVLQALHAAPLATIATAQPVAETSMVTLEQVTITGPAEASEVPQGAARISLTLRGLNDQDWTSVAPTLRLGDGSQQSAPEVRTLDTGRTELRFLVTAPVEALPAEFRLTDPASRRMTRWQVPITPPIDRLHLLQQALRVDGLTVSGAGELTLIVTNTGTQPLSLMTTDLVIEQAGARQGLTSISGIDTPLTVGETRSLLLTLPPDLRGGGTLNIGTARYQLTRE